MITGDKENVAGGSSGIRKYSASRGTETSAYMYNNHPLTATKAQQSKNVPSFPSIAKRRGTGAQPIMRN